MTNSEFLSGIFPIVLPLGLTVTLQQRVWLNYQHDVAIKQLNVYMQL